MNNNSIKFLKLNFKSVKLKQREFKIEKFRFLATIYSVVIKDETIEF